MAWHQFRATKGEPLGFLCMVNAERDRPQLPSADDVARLRQKPRHRGVPRRQAMTANTTGPVLWSVDARGVATVTLNRPEVNNAYNGALIEGVLERARCARWPQGPARGRAEGQRQAFPGRRRPEMDQFGPHVLAGGEPARLARDRGRGAAAQHRAGADGRAGAGRLLRRRHRASSRPATWCWRPTTRCSRSPRCAGDCMPRSSSRSSPMRSACGSCAAMR